MVQKDYIYRFLKELSQNNSKAWMDANRDRYERAKQRWITEVELLLDRLSHHDPYFSGIEPKSTLMRINNDIRFNPDKPLYKDFFTFSPMGRRDPVAKIFLSTGVHRSFLGGGLYRPDSRLLGRFRDTIDQDGEAFLAILNDADFRRLFGGLSDSVETLKTSPQGFSSDHRFIEILRRKSIIVQAELTHEMVVSDGFVDYVEEVYLAMRPFTDYLEKAIAEE